MAHIAEACHILEDGSLKTRRICNGRLLNRPDIAVTWLSANEWGGKRNVKGPGSIYGTVSFAFSWSEQIARRRFYWVEAIAARRPDAYRILITHRDRSGYLKPYDPSSACGPLREREGLWYFNAAYQSEFMFEAALPLRKCLGFDIIPHNRTICHVSDKQCPDLFEHPAGRLLAFILGNGVHSIDHLLRRPCGDDASWVWGDTVLNGIDEIKAEFGADDGRFGGFVGRKKARSALLRGAMALFGDGRPKAAHSLVDVMNSRQVFENALKEVREEHFGS